MKDAVQFKALLPADVKAFLASEATRYGSTQSSEIIRAVRERMDRVQAAAGAKFGGQTPAAAHSHSDALAGAGQFHT